MGEHLLGEVAVVAGCRTVGSYLITEEPRTGASANLIAFLIRDLKTRSPKFSSRISTASFA